MRFSFHPRHPNAFIRIRLVAFFFLSDSPLALASASAPNSIIEGLDLACASRGRGVGDAESGTAPSSIEISTYIDIRAEECISTCARRKSQE